MGQRPVELGGEPHDFDGLAGDWDAQLDLPWIVGLLLRGWRKGLDAEAGVTLAVGRKRARTTWWWCDAGGRRRPSGDSDAAQAGAARSRRGNTTRAQAIATTTTAAEDREVACVRQPGEVGLGSR